MTSHKECIKGTFGNLLVIDIDGNSRAPLRIPTSPMPSPILAPVYGKTAVSYSHESVAASYVAHLTRTDSQIPLLSCGNLNESLLGEVDRKLEVWNQAILDQAHESRITKVGHMVRSKLSKIRHFVLLQSEEDQATRDLVKACRTSSLATKVRKADDIDAVKRCITRECSRNISKSNTSTESLLPSCPGLTHGSSSSDTPNDSRKSSVDSTHSILSNFAPRRFSTTTLTDAPRHKRRISQPLELAPDFHPRQLSQQLELERHNTNTSTTPVFRVPRYQAPSPDDCTACKIIRVMANTNTTIPEETPPSTSAFDSSASTAVATPCTKVLRRLSDEKGNSFIEEIPGTDKKGGKKVLLQWGPDADEIIPPYIAKSPYRLGLQSLILEARMGPPRPESERFMREMEMEREAWFADDDPYKHMTLGEVREAADRLDRSMF